MNDTILILFALILYWSIICLQKLRIILGLFNFDSCNSFVPFAPWSTKPISTQPNSEERCLKVRSGQSPFFFWLDVRIVGWYQALVVNFYWYWRHYFDSHCREAILVFRSWKEIFVRTYVSVVVLLMFLVLFKNPYISFRRSCSVTKVVKLSLSINKSK